MKRLGVLGTLVRDTIHLPGAGPPSSPRAAAEAWGGIAYALAAFDHVLAAGWTVVPVLKVGEDVAKRALPFLRSFSKIRDMDGDMDFVRVVPEPNNRVELTYRSRTERVEVLTGGVPGWSRREMDRVLPTLDALYVNFISGIELGLEGALQVRDRLNGPTYADLHSLFLDIDGDGLRSPRYLPSSERWAGSFDTVQMNEVEFALFARGAPAPWSAAERAMVNRLGTIVVTRGADGAEIMTKRRSGAPPVRETVPVARGTPPGEGGAAPRDPTGCGDVWGAAFFAAVLGKASRREASRLANAMAHGNLGCSGAEAFRNAVSPAAGLELA